jgi:tRNA uridine 5-carboxymethylaminomethyl modification enzyme
MGLAGKERMELLEQKREGIRLLREKLEATSVELGEVNAFLEAAGTTPLKEKTRFISVAKRPQVDLQSLLRAFNLQPDSTGYSEGMLKEIVEAVEINIKYEGYISRERLMAEKISRLEKIKLAENLDYDRFKSISTEARQKLSRVRPETIGQASRISGVSPSDISVLLVYMGR